MTGDGCDSRHSLLILVRTSLNKANMNDLIKFTSDRNDVFFREHRENLVNAHKTTRSVIVVATQKDKENFKHFYGVDSIPAYALKVDDIEDRILLFDDSVFKYVANGETSHSERPS